MSTIAIVGGHGKIARLLTRDLTGAGHRVISIIRQAEHVPDIESDGAEAVVLDLESGATSKLTEAIRGADAVVFAAGAGGGSGTVRKRTVDLGAALHTIDAALQAGVRRVVQISFVKAQHPTPAGTSETFAAYWDAKRQADIALRGSGLDWTIIRPGALTDDPLSGRGVVAADLSDTDVRTSRADVAALIAIVLDEPASIGRDLDVGEGDLPLREALAAALA